MPNRIIRESARTSPTLAKLSHGAERCFWRLITLADDFGRFNTEPDVVRGLCFPTMLARITKRQVLAWLQELREAELIRCYRVGDKHVASFVTWDRHERTRAEKSKFPDPPASDNGCCQPTTNVAVVEVVSELHESELPGVELERARAGRAGGSNGHHSATDTAPERRGFEAFWTAYPRKEARKEAEKAWRKINPDQALTARVMVALAAHCAGEDFRRENGRFIPRAATWLNGERWTDEVKPAPPWSVDAGGLTRFANRGRSA